MNHKSQTSFDMSHQKTDVMYIYGLYAASDDTETIMYVGKTQNLITRWSDHIKCRSRSRKDEWIRSLLESNDYPALKVLEQCSLHSGTEREWFWISHHNKINPNLKNTVVKPSAANRLPCDVPKLQFKLDSLLWELQLRDGMRYTYKDIANQCNSNHPNFASKIESIASNSAHQGFLVAMSKLLDFFQKEGMPITVGDLFEVRREE